MHKLFMIAKLQHKIYVFLSHAVVKSNTFVSKVTTNQHINESQTTVFFVSSPDYTLLLLFSVIVAAKFELNPSKSS